MARQKESQFGDRVDRDLKSIGAWFYNVNQAIGCGIPDRIGCLNGKFFAIELKQSYKEAMRQTGRIVLQRHILKRIRSVSGWAEIVYPDGWSKYFDELKDFLCVQRN